MIQVLPHYIFTYSAKFDIRQYQYSPHARGREDETGVVEDDVGPWPLTSMLPFIIHLGRVRCNRSRSRVSGDPCAIQKGLSLINSHTDNQWLPSTLSDLALYHNIVKCVVMGCLYALSESSRQHHSAVGAAACGRSYIIFPVTIIPVAAPDILKDTLAVARI